MAHAPKPKRLKLSLRKKTFSESDSKNDNFQISNREGVKATSDETFPVDRSEIDIGDVDDEEAKNVLPPEELPEVVTETQQPSLLHLRQMLWTRRTKFTEWHMLGDLPKTEAFAIQVTKNSETSILKQLPAAHTSDDWIALPKPDLSWYRQKPQRKVVLDLGSYYGDPDKYTKLAESYQFEERDSHLDGLAQKSNDSYNSKVSEINNCAFVPYVQNNFTVIKPKLARQNYSEHKEETSNAYKCGPKYDEVDCMPSTSASSSLRSCPLCQMEFNKIIGQVDIDAHIAACLSAADDDFKW